MNEGRLGGRSNSVDPNKLKSTDTIEPGSARRRRTQLPNEAELTLFDFDRDSSVLKSLTGKVRAELAEFFKQPTGSSNLRVSTKTKSHELPGLCKRLLDLYNSDAYLTTFPDIRSIEPIKDPVITSALDLNLEIALRGGSKDILLTVPDFLDYSAATWFSFTGLRSGKLYDDVFIDRYYEYVGASKTPLASISISDLRKHKLVVLNENEAPIGAFVVYKSIIFETSLPDTGAVYHLNEGTWYRFEAGLVAKLRTYLDPCCVAADLPDFDHAGEGEYNESVAQHDVRYANLDKSNISLHGQKQIEPCDLVKIEGGFAKLIHVKISTLSASLSHLFNQGLASIELLRDEIIAVDNLVDLVESRKSAAEAGNLRTSIESGKICIQFAIITHKDPAKLSDNLPLFSRLSLARTLKSLNRMGVKREYGFVRDISPTTPGKNKTKKAKGAELDDLDLDVVLEDIPDAEE